MLQNQEWINFNYVNEPHYPKLVRLFHCNLNFESNSLTLRSFVLGKKIVISPKHLSVLFSIKAGIEIHIKPSLILALTNLLYISPSLIQMSLLLWKQQHRPLFQLNLASFFSSLGIIFCLRMGIKMRSNSSLVLFSIAYITSSSLI